jgi:hypothetical protein
MRLLPTFALVSASACAVIAAAALYDGDALRAAEMSTIRGGNSNQMQCSATCNHLNGYDTPCADKAAGAACTICSGGPNYNYITQVTNPVPSGCTSNNTGYQTDPNNQQQGCGFQMLGATCQTVGTGLVCQGGQKGKTACNGSVLVQAQPNGGQ